MKPARGFAPILIVLIVLSSVLLVAGGLFAYQRNLKINSELTPLPVPAYLNQASTDDSSPEASAKDETANWKTYTNTEFGYEIKYPVKWFIQGPYGGQAGYDCTLVTSGVATIIELSRTELNDCGFVAEQLPPSEAEITILANKVPYEDIYNILGPSERVTINQIPFAKYKFTESSELPNVQATRLYTNKNGMGYLIFIKQSDKLGSYEPLYDQILSTFKFTN